MTEAITEPKYQGKVSAKIKGTAEKVWPFIEDFCSLHKLLPSVAICYKIDGFYGQPGLIRYCQTTQPDDDQTTKRWAHQKLISIHPNKRCLSFEVMENNMGFHSFVGTWKVIEIKGAEDQFGCEVEWSFISGPIDGWKFEDLLAYAESSIKAVGERLDKILQSTD